MNSRCVCLLAGSCLVLAVITGGALAAPPSAPAGGSTGVADPARLAGVTMPFEANVGQDDARVAFTARTPDATLFVTRDGRLVHRFPAADGAGRDGSAASAAPDAPRRGARVLTETLIGARASPQGAARSATRVSRYVGNDPARWRRDVPAFDRVRLGEAWPGITVELAVRGDGVEKLFTVAPGADVRRIAIGLNGAQGLELAGDGALVAHTGSGPVRFSPPQAWQDIGGQRRRVAAAYALIGKRYGFTLGRHDRAHPVVIDPLVQATYLGGNGYDYAHAVALDASGNVYVAGMTASSEFPGTAGGAQAAHSGASHDGFVAKLSPDLTRLIQATYLGGNGLDTINAMAVDASGNVLVAGFTHSTDLPKTAGGAQATYAGGDWDVFVARLSPDLTTLIQSTYLGGTSYEQASALAVDASGNVLVAGYTLSDDFPGTAGGAVDRTPKGNDDGFVAKLNPGLTALIQATYLGGSNRDQVSALAVRSDGAVFVAGKTYSTDFPQTTGGAQPAIAVFGGGWDGFVAGLNGGLTLLVQATYLGGTADDEPAGVALDADGAVLVTGVTASDDFPHTAGGAQATHAAGGGNDVFVARLNAGLTTLIQATYLGGGGADDAGALALEATGMVHVVGSTASADFPQPAHAAPAVRAGVRDGFVATLNPGLTTLSRTTFIGGSGETHANALAVDARGYVFVVGHSYATDLPRTAGGAQPVHAVDTNGEDSFVALIGAISYQGMWWAAPAESEPGWGINLAHQGDTIFASWFTYGFNGKPLWLVVAAHRTAPGTYTGKLYTGTGPAFNAVPFDPAQVVPLEVGIATLTFTDDDHATLGSTLYGVTQTRQITREVFAEPVPACALGARAELVALATNYQDMWWAAPAGSESGWGVNLAHQGDTLFATWFTFGADGKPLWMVAAVQKSAPGVYSGKVYSGTGPPFSAVPFDPAQVVPIEVGTATLTFTDGNNATFAYDVYGSMQSKAITREVFGAPGTFCE